MRAPRIVEFVLLGLATLAFLGIATPSVNAQGGGWAEIGRGRSHIEYQKGDEIKQEIYGGPIFTQADNGDWVSFIFTDLGDRYIVKYPHASVHFFDYYSTLWTENFEDVVIYLDRWTVQYLNKQGKWTDAPPYNIVRSYDIVSEGEIRLIRSGDTFLGPRVENYIFRRGAPVKIKIEQTCDSAQTLRFVWKPSGIVATTEKIHKDNENRASRLTYWDENNWVGSLAWFDELEVVDNISVAVDEHAQGRKATITFGNFEVGAGGAAVLDPTETFYSATSDGDLRRSATSYSTVRDYSTGTLSISATIFTLGQYLTGGNYLIYRGFVFFDTSNLPDDATIVNATLSLYKYGDQSDNDFDIVVQNGQPTYPREPLVAGDYNRTYYLDNGGSLDTTAFTSGYNDITLDENARENWIRKDNTTKLCLRSSNDIDNIAPTGKEYVYIRSSESGSGFQPRLTVTWTTPLPQPYDLRVENQVEPSRLITSTPEFSFKYYNENGDNMKAHQLQVGTSAGDNSLWDQTTTENAENDATVTITYAGTAVSRGTPYYWRCRVQDN